MFAYGKTASNGIAAMSYLAIRYGTEEERCSSLAIAEDRGLSKPLVAKLLTLLSQSGLVLGSPGPGGGYALARPPSEITLWDIVRLFEKTDNTVTCPFGKDWCGNNDPCPLHHSIVRLYADAQRFLKETTLAIFIQPMQKIHGHEFLHLLSSKREFVPIADLEQHFGPNVRFHTCAAENLTVSGLIDFLLERGKVEIDLDRVRFVQSAEVCDHG
jgi:probable metal-binding protein